MTQYHQKQTQTARVTDERPDMPSLHSSSLFCTLLLLFTLICQICIIVELQSRAAQNPSGNRKRPPAKCLLFECVFSTSADGSASCSGVAAEKTRVESVELVLPPHANHQVCSCSVSLTVKEWIVNGSIGLRWWDTNTASLGSMIFCLNLLCIQVNTFGGQIMAWMVNVATIAAR